MRVFKLFLIFALLLKTSVSFAAWIVDHFTVTFSKSEVLSWESIDLIIEAVDENDNVVKDYNWTITAFSETDPELVIPEELASDAWYTFRASDEWKVKFENSVKFITPWTQELSVYSLDDDYLIWQWSIEVVSTSTTSTEDIEIITPENQITIWEDSIKVSWETKKNHQVIITLNEKEEFYTTSNSDWIFEKEVSWLEDWENEIVAYVLDADSKKIWTSSKVIINKDGSLPTFKKIKLSPVWEDWVVEEGKNILVDVYANPWLKEVWIEINDWVIPLEETDDWIYSGNFNTPDWDKDYEINVLLSDNFGHIYEEKAAATIKVKKVELPAATTTNTWETVTTTTPVVQTPVATTTTEETSFKVTWLKIVRLKNKSILTWDPTPWAAYYNIYKRLSEDNSNIVLIDTSLEPRYEIEITWDKVKYEYFAVKPVKKDTNWISSVEWELSSITEIQTGPEIYFLILVSLLLGWAYFYIQRRKQYN